jgi:TRAP-type C4-dicarboxylate transport system substrate-binding protein
MHSISRGACALTISLIAFFSWHSAMAAGAQKILRLNENSSAGRPEGVALRYFKQRVEKATHKTIAIDLHLNGGLGNPQISVENMMFGGLDLYSGNLADYLPLMIDEVSGLQTPFLVPGRKPADLYLASPLLGEARDKVLNSRHIRFLEMGAVREPFHIIAATRAIAGSGDLAGLRMTSEKPLSKDAAQLWRALGVTYVPMELSRFKEALASKKIDAVLYSDLAGANSDVLSLASHLVGVDDCPQIWQISINEKAWQGLTAEEKRALSDAATESVPIFETEAKRQFEARLAHITANGHIIYRSLVSETLRAGLGQPYRELVADGALNPKVLETTDRAVRAAGSMDAKSRRE